MPLKPLNAVQAHVLPLLLFVATTPLAVALQASGDGLPWWRLSPQHLVYPLQSLLVGAVLWWGWPHYRFEPWRDRGWALILAVLGIAVWIAPGAYWRHAQAAGIPAAAWWPWLGIVDRSQASYAVDIFEPGSLLQCLDHGLRLIRAVIIAALAEEVFWRGWLMRHLLAAGEDFRAVPFGTHRIRVYAVVTAMVVMIHSPPDRFAALIWGTLMYLLCVRSRSLGACVLMHAFGNLLLGVYVVSRQQWGYW